MTLRLLLAICLFTCSGEAKTIGWDLGELKTMALNGDTSAQLRLGLAYSSGIGADKNSREAFYWFEKAAKQGEPIAALFLAKAYTEGYGTHQDLAQVMHWYREAALGSNAFARRKLVRMLQNDTNGSVEEVEAYAWHLIGREAGDDELSKNLELLTKNGNEQLIAAGTAKSIELRVAIDERRNQLLPLPKDPDRGTFLYPTGERYFGQVKTGRPHGHGILDAPNGDRLYGEFRDGRAHGYGMLFAQNGDVLFSGLWDNDKAIADDGAVLPLSVLRTKPDNRTIRGSDQK